ncbi:hypothetical protein CVT24_003258 [Panaeolus cyanescens]|uniref:SH3 domain-containing protein n=1 Tax=Panaeolus cyanescens TaxID=181874 RepID=A0A409YXH3_9AGAR|nr:hypothetical protein CVT24_003258 [Panaeolus cyanescens]
MGLEPAELARWTRFAAKGGIGKCTALCDFKAANPDDLMFLKDDEITVLLQLPDKEGYYLGYCEGVVGRFCGSDVHFHSKLKKPVMTKRTSISSSSVTTKSPTPSSPSPSVQQYPDPPSRRGSLSSRRESVSSTSHGRTTPNRPQTLPPSLRNQASEESEKEKERRGTYGLGFTVTPPVPHHAHHSNTPSFTYSASTGTDSSLNTPNFAGSFSPPPSDLRKLFPTESDSRPNSVASPPPQLPLPPAPPLHKYTSNAPPPLTLASSNAGAQQQPSGPVKQVTTPLRIMKRSGTLTSGNMGVGSSSMTSPPATVVSFGEQGQPQAQPQAVQPPSVSHSPPHSQLHANPTTTTQTLLVPPPPPSTVPLSAPPTTTTTPMISSPLNLVSPPQSKHLSLAPTATLADAHAGIGMSLLSGLMGGMDSDSDEDSDDGAAILAKAKQRLADQAQAQAASPVTKKILNEDSEDEHWSQSSMDPNSMPNSANEFRKVEDEDEQDDRRGSWTESAEGTVEGLMYAREEPEDVTTKIAPAVAPPRSSSTAISASNATSTIPFVNPGFLSPTTSPTTGTFNPSSPPSSIRSRNDSLATSPPLTSHFPPERERRPSTATVASVKSSASKATVNTQSSWEGAADIYDDYRYSRYSLARMSVFNSPGSVPLISNAPPGGGATSPSLRGRADSNSTTASSFRERVDSAASASAYPHRLAMMQEEESPPPSANTFGHVSRMGSVIDSRVGSVMGSVADSRGSMMGGIGARGSGGTFGVGSAYATPSGVGSASPGPGMMVGGLKVDGEGGRDRRSKRASRRHTRRLEGGQGDLDEGDESDGSVYSKNSRDSRLSIGSIDESPMSPVLANPAAFASFAGLSTSDSTKTATNVPPPLDLSSKPDPLLSTSFASPGSTTTSPRTSDMDALSPLNTLNAWSPGMVMGSVVSGRVGEGEGGEEERGIGGGPSLGGIASRMRMRLEEARVGSPSLPDGSSAREGLGDGDRSRDTITGLGQRIVVEDEEELPSRIEDTVETLDSSMLSMGSVMRGLDVKHQSAVVEGADESVGDVSVDSVDTMKREEGFEPKTPPNRTISITSTPASPPSVASTPPQPSHLRPSMRELREGATVPIPGTNQRRSLFLPHPNAPKPPPTVDEAGRERGPMYIVAPTMGSNGPPGQARSPPPMNPSGPFPPLGQGLPRVPHPSQLPLHPSRPHPSLVGVIKMALSLPPPPARAPMPVSSGKGQPPPPPRGPTIYARFEVDLASSVGPVPVMWSVEPAPARAPGSTLPPASGPMMGGPPGTVIHAGPPGSMPPSTAPIQQRQSQPAPSRKSSNSVMSDTEVLRSRGSVGGGVTASTAASDDEAGGMGKVIPRANFFPKKPGMRPRSRSFSGFNSTTAEVAVPLQKGNHYQEAEIPSANEVKQSLTRSSSTTASGLASNGPSIPTSSSSPPTSSALSTSSSPPTSSPLNPGTSSLNPPPSSKPVKSSPLRPSPLSLSSTSADPPLKPPGALGGLKSPSSPLAKSMFSRTDDDEDEKVKETEKEAQKDQDEKERENIQEKVSESPSPMTSPVLGGRNELRSVTSRSTLNDAVLSRSNAPAIAVKPSLPNNPAPGRVGSLQSLPQRRETDPSSFVDSSRPSTDDTRSITVVSPPPVTRQNSLRSKLSLPNLRRNRSRQDDDTLQSPVTPLTPLSITGSYSFASAQSQAQTQAQGDSEMLQVQDMEFELVRPNFALGAARTSEDSGVLGREGSLDLRIGGGGSSALGTSTSSGSMMTSTPNDGFLRAESPMSFVSSTAGGTDTVSIAASLAKERGKGQKEKEVEAANMEAHRARELKWMSLISSFSSSTSGSTAGTNATGANTIGAGGGVSIPTATLTAAQARKSKKVKKLVQEGVPASVRYLVWSFLTDGKARCVPGVYRQLCDREFKRAAVLGDIERDAAKALSGSGEGSTGGRERGMTGDEGDAEARADTREGVVSLLQAYLSMVPDVVYDIGLIHVTSTLLLLAPEEDAFWIFVSIMDTHIRPYFSPPHPASPPSQFPVSLYLEVDAGLFAKALENNEPQLARRIFNDIGIPKEQLLGGWLKSLFVRALPGEVAVRVWDVFLYEGIPFLVRTALALTSLLKRPILELPPTPQSQRTLLNVLSSPSPSLIPPPEVFLSIAWGVKFKDDDFRKVREKEVKEREKKLDSGRRVTNAGGLLGTLGSSRGVGISLPRI